MKKILFTLITATLFGCSSSGSDEPADPIIDEQPAVKFEKTEVSVGIGGSLLLGLQTPLDDCRYSVKDDFIAYLSVNGEDIKVVGKKAGATEIYATRGESSDTCTVTVTPQYSHIKQFLFDMGSSPEYIASNMKSHQGITALNLKNQLYFYLNTEAVVYYQFDSNNRLVAIKEVLSRPDYTFEKVNSYIAEYFDYKSSSTNVYWYTHPGVMIARSEKFTDNITVLFGADATVIYQYFPY